MNPALIPIIAEKGKQFQDNEKKIIGNIVVIIVVILCIVLIWKFGSAIVQRIKENQVDKNGGSQINQWINRIQVALHEHWYNEDEEACYDVAKEIGTKEMFAKVNSAYKNKYQITMEDDLVKWLNNEELSKFYSYIQ